MYWNFANNLMLWPKSSSQLQDMIRSLNAVSKEVGLEMYLSKTMLKTNHAERTIVVDNEILGTIYNKIYLLRQTNKFRQGIITIQK